ncbi:hypothetical protein [Sinorhizobium sp. BG8]|uniref:hypothetical protein n=1 Tax=Sinorhizobium sp. BG8 TaxID=2613773 RepID=UPI00193E6D2D|nr:hypothetical protein [Sinorhizobium sp. BG8]QRM56077.1 hypothetical protein F3Y30_17205 [Sinorhizobium sp. BG8]
MVWIFAIAAIAILYLAIRFRRFQSWVEPVLTIVFAFGLGSAILIWLSDSRPPVPSSSGTSENSATIAPDEIELGNLQYVQGKPSTSYKVTGTVTNRSRVTIQSFRLTVRLADCPDGACHAIGEDTALIIVRVLPGATHDFTTYAVFTGSDLTPVGTPKWEWEIRDIRPYRP